MAAMIVDYARNYDKLTDTKAKQLLTTNLALSYGTIGAGGFLGVDRHDVVIPVDRFKMQDGKIILSGATKDAIKAMPKFEYAK
jgi:hypothetical protein